MSKYFFTVFLLLVFFTNGVTAQGYKFHNKNNASIKEGTDLPLGYNLLFGASGECLLCHNSMTNQQGTPMGILNDWRSTMMANAAKDPLWRAKVSHETLVNPQHAEVLQDVCTRCHAPLGNFNAHFLGQELYSIAEMELDSIALDGVSCTLCHQIKSASLGNYSGNMLIGTDWEIWGPYQTPFQNPMINNTGFIPVYGEQVFDSELCGSCHTLITNTVDLDGNLTGGQFVEQAIYHEWKNSLYAENGTSCQSCHVPQISDSVKISTMPPWLGTRSPFGKHHFVGGNVFMQKILKANIDELGITADADRFDTTIARTSELLSNSTLELSIVEYDRTNDTLFLEIGIENLAGHKFPAGFPSRRSFLEIVMLTDNGDTIFHSGKMDKDFEIITEDLPYEEHHPTISSDTQVQIYELVMGDVNADYTTVLERAAYPLKDNRLPPLGFKTWHPSYDTTVIVGQATTDDNFNKNDAEEGTGADILFVHAPVLGYTGAIEIVAQVHYQTVSKRWLEDMFSYSSPEIEKWKNMYNDSDKKPFTVASVMHTSLATHVHIANDSKLAVFPNPASDKIFISDAENLVGSCSIYDLNGHFVQQVTFENKEKQIDFKGSNGIYLIQLVGHNKQQYVRKVVVN